MIQLSNIEKIPDIIHVIKNANKDGFSFLKDDLKAIVLNKLKEKASTIVITQNKQTHTFIFVTVDEKKATSAQWEKLRIVGNTIYQLLKTNKIAKAGISFDKQFDNDEKYALLQGIILSDYSFDKYLAKPNLYKVELVINKDALPKSSIDELLIIKESVHICKDLVNEPVSFLTAVQYSKEIQKIGKSAGFSTTVLKQNDIKKEKMGGLLAVNAGSSAEATFNILSYKPAKHKNKKPLVLVGKGVVYDTGGLSLKPTRNSMDMMKCDMAGSATVVGAMVAIAKAKLPYHVIGLIPAVENRPGYEATCPGDIITMYDGTTVEVMDTDAEGRLILADALHYAKRYQPELVLDFATLTGAAMRAIGREASVIMGNATDDIKNKITIAANETGERTVEFPLWDEYAEYIKSDVADLKNLGPIEAGAITAGKFLEHFTNYPWMHFDIAGPAYVAAPYNYRGKWATAYGIRLLFKFVQNICK